MINRPVEIYKIKHTIDYKDTKVHGEIWFDRWQENVWFAGVYKGRYKIFTPFEINKRVHLGLNVLFKLIYSHSIADLIPDGIRLLKKIPKVDGSLYHTPIILGIEHGVIFKK